MTQEENKIIWEATEYEEKERSTDWFWALGVIVVAGSLAALIFGNYFFAILLIIGGGMLGYFAIKKPEMISYKLNEKGFFAHSEFYPYEKIKAFWVQTGVSNLLFVRTGRLFMPEQSVPIESAQAEAIRGIMRRHGVTEVEMTEHPGEKVMERLGF